MKELETKYIINGAAVIPVVEVGDDFLVAATEVFSKSDIQLFGTREDARYYCLLRDLESGKKTIENYKSSKYYQYYLKRL
jgi:hypothetical protein